MQQRVFLDLGGSIGAAIAAHVRSDRVEAGFGQGAELMAPRIPGLREAVAQHDQRALALLRNMHGNPVALDRAVRDLAHGSLPSERARRRRGLLRGGGPRGPRETRPIGSVERKLSPGARIWAMRAAI